MSLLRLKKRCDFLRVSGFRASVAMPSVIVQCAPSDSGVFRFGLTASRRVGGAVQRNRSKRRLRAVLLGLSSGNLITPVGVDCVFIARKETISAPFETLLQDAQRGFVLCLEKIRGRTPPSFVKK
jgi:ribonuclease P protein component